MYTYAMYDDTLNEEDQKLASEKERQKGGTKTLLCGWDDGTKTIIIIKT